MVHGTLWIICSSSRRIGKSKLTELLSLTTGKETWRLVSIILVFKMDFIVNLMVTSIINFNNILTILNISTLTLFRLKVNNWCWMAKIRLVLSFILIWMMLSWINIAVLIILICICLVLIILEIEEFWVLLNHRWSFVLLPR